MAKVPIPRSSGISILIISPSSLTATIFTTDTPATVFRDVVTDSASKLTPSTLAKNSSVIGVPPPWSSVV
jgi:hypothetical protein